MPKRCDIKSILIIAKERPKLVFGFGGYVSFPVSFASIFFRIPLVIYENNSVLGRANKYLLPISKKIFIGNVTPINFPEKYKYKVNQVGHILSEKIMNYVPNNSRNHDDVFSILVFGFIFFLRVFLAITL